MTAKPASRVVMRAIKDLKPNAQNPRIHTAKQIRKIIRSMRRFGFVGVIYIDTFDSVIAGNGRLEAAAMAGLSEVPTICIEGLTPDEIRAYVIADNQLALESGWSNDLIRIEFQHLILNTDIDVELTGFDTGEIDLILGSAGRSMKPWKRFQKSLAQRSPVVGMSGRWNATASSVAMHLRIIPRCS